MDTNLQALCQEVIKLTKTVGCFIKNEQQKFTSDLIEIKGKNDFVSYVDKTSEKLLVEKLNNLLPEAGFIAEEGTNNKKREVYNWIIDPLDGTTNFIHGIPCFAISIALMRRTEIVLGVVYEINFDECFYAWENSKAYLNDKEINVSTTDSLSNSLLATGFPYYDYSKISEFMELFAYILKHTHGLRRLGSAATDLAYVACGRFDGFYEYGLQPWDVAAGAFIVQCAGGKVSDFTRGENYIFGKEIVASNSACFNEFTSKVDEFFN